MKKLFCFLLSAFCFSALAADKINIIVPAYLTGDTALSRQPLTLVPTSPLPRTYNTNVFSRQAIARYTDTNGICTFSNIVWGYYRLDVPGNPGTSFNLEIGTNFSGTVNVVALITNSTAIPPNPATNYYTQAQTDALIAGVGTATAALTNNETRAVTLVSNLTARAVNVGGSGIGGVFRLYDDQFGDYVQPLLAYDSDLYVGGTTGILELGLLGIYTAGQVRLWSQGEITIAQGYLGGDIRGATNGHPALATNNAAASDNFTLTRTGDHLKWVPGLFSYLVGGSNAIYSLASGAAKLAWDDDNGQFNFLANVNIPVGLGGFLGDGSALTDLNASALTSGTVPLAQLPAIPQTSITGARWDTNAANGTISPASGVTGVVIDKPLTNSAGFSPYQQWPTWYLNGNGDSIIAEANSSSNKTAAASFMTWVMYLSGGRIHYHYNVGQAGAQAKDLYAYANTGSTALHGRGSLAEQAHMLKSSHNVIYVGANDVSVATNLPLALTNLFWLAWDLKTRGSQPILSCIAPNGDTAIRKIATARWNDEVRKLGAVLQVPVVDFWGGMAQPGTNMLRATDTADYIHPNQVGAKRMAEIWLTQMGIQPSMLNQNPWLAQDVYETNNVALTNGLFMDFDGNSSPDDWTLTAANGETVSLLSDGEILGNWVTLTKGTATGEATLTNSFLYTNFAAADEIVFAGRVWLTNCVAGAGGGVKVALAFNTGDPNNSGWHVLPVNLVTNDIPRFGVFSQTARVPAGCSNAVVVVTMTNMTGTLRLAQLKVANTTSLLSGLPRPAWYAPFGGSTNTLAVHEGGQSVGLGIAPDSALFSAIKLKVLGQGSGVPDTTHRNSTTAGYSGSWLYYSAGNIAAGFDYANSSVSSISNNVRLFTARDPISVVYAPNGVYSSTLATFSTNGNFTVSGSVTATNGFLLPTNGVPANLVAGRMYSTNGASAITFAAFASVPDAAFTKTFITVSNSSASPFAVTFPSGTTCTNQTVAPALFNVEASKEAIFEVYHNAQRSTNVVRVY